MISQTFLVRANKHTPQVVNCSVMDVLLKNLPVPVVFFYRKAIHQDLLINALEQTLSDFPIFAGTLKNINGNLSIDCNNLGVSFCVSQEDLLLEQVVRELPTIEKERLIDKIATKKTISHQNPITTIKIAYFACGGMSVGICWHHSIGDMQTFMCLMKAWANKVNNREYALPLIVSERDEYLQSHLENNDNINPNIRYLKTKELFSLLFYTLFSARNKSNLKFYLSKKELENMRKQISSKSNQKLSTNDVLCSHIACIISDLDMYNKKRNLAIAVNYRLKAKLPSNILGNFISIINLPIDRGAEVSQLAKKIRASVDNFINLHLDFFSSKKYIEQNGGIKKSTRFISTSLDPLRRTLLITNWANFGVYDVVFEDSKPFYFTYLGNSPFPWLSSIVEGFNGEGLIYSVWLPRQLAKKLMQENNLSRIHQYRDRQEILSETVVKLGWLL